MSLHLTIHSRQSTRGVEVTLLRRIAKDLFAGLPQVQAAELGICLVAAPEMSRINEAFLQHAGSTDVITFNYSEPATRNSEAAPHLQGEIFICVDEAVAQARCFRTTWQSELVRYLVHGVLHLLGHDDQAAVDRRKMKRVENRLVKVLTARFALSRLARQPRLRS